MTYSYIKSIVLGWAFITITKILVPVKLQWVCPFPYQGTHKTKKHLRQCTRNSKKDTLTKASFDIAWNKWNELKSWTFPVKFEETASSNWTLEGQKFGPGSFNTMTLGCPGGGIYVSQERGFHNGIRREMMKTLYTL